MGVLAIDPLAGPALSDLGQLLADLRVNDLSGLSEQVSRYAGCQAWVPALREQDGLPDRLLIRVGGQSLYLSFPFSANDLWNGIDDLETEIDTRCHAEAFWTVFKRSF